MDHWKNYINNKVDHPEDDILNIVNTDGDMILIMRNFIDN